MEAGYSGGWTDEPNYRSVCSGGTGHAEVVRVEYDPSQVSLTDLLNRFWKLHTPFRSHETDPHSQYRSAVYTSSGEQLAVVLAEKERLEATGRKLTTEVRMSGPFWRAEEYHQRYYEKKGISTCRLT